MNGSNSSNSVCGIGRLASQKGKFQVSLSIAILLLLSVLLGIALTYYFVTPKIIIKNISSSEFDEFIISLPASRVSFGPLEAESSSTIFYSRQHEAGTGSYSLLSDGSEISSGDFLYGDGYEIGRVLRFSIDDAGEVIVEQ